MKNLKLLLLNSKLQRLILILLVLLLLSMVVSQCKNKETAIATNDALLNEVKYYKLKNSKQEVASKQIAELSKKQLQQQIETDSLLKELSNEFAKIKSVKTLHVKTEIVKITEKFSEPITIKDIDTVSGELKFERSGAKFEKWYELGYKVTQDSLTIEPYKTWTEVKIVDGFKRKWFLGKQTYNSDILFTNPFMEVSQIKAYQVTVPKKWYDTRLFNVAVGFGISEIIRRR